MISVEAVSLDFYNTLVYHRDGRGRGRHLVEFLTEHGMRPASWDHAVLYDVFQRHDDEYDPEADRARRDAYYVRLAQRVFQRLEISGPAADGTQHAQAIWRILGPSSFRVFDDALPTLRALKALGYPLVLISNWQRGLRHFVTELGLGEFFDHILGSADLGIAKPDPRIFAAACERLRTPASRLLHVGDSVIDDYEGGSASGVRVVLVDRHHDDEAPVERHTIHRLHELPALLESRV